MIAAESLSIMQLTQLLASAPGGSRIIQRSLAQTYSEFVQILLQDIDEVIQKMEHNRHRFYKSTEDQITFHIASVLDGIGYEASNGTQLSGSVDLTVKKKTTNWIWTSEAKIYTSLTKVEQGFAQLSTRYSPGNTEEAVAGMLIYVRTPNISKKISAWKSHLVTCGYEGMNLSTSAIRPQLYFESQHIHDSSGLPFRVRHMGIWLHFRPEDPSGLAAKIYTAVDTDSDSGN